MVIIRLANKKENKYTAAFRIEIAWLYTCTCIKYIHMKSDRSWLQLQMYRFLSCRNDKVKKYNKIYFAAKMFKTERSYAFSRGWLWSKVTVPPSGPGSSFGIATELRAGRSGIESRWGRDFPPVQTGPWAHPASCTMGTRSFPEGKVRPGRAADHSPLLVPRSWKSRAKPLPTLGPTPGL